MSDGLPGMYTRQSTNQKELYNQPMSDGQPGMYARQSTNQKEFYK